MIFDTELVINYLNILNEPAKLNDLDSKAIIEEFMRFAKQPKDEWDVSDCDAAEIFEIMVLEECVLNRALHKEREGEFESDVHQLLDEHYYPFFSHTFADMEPNPSLSISGWINFNYCRDYQQKNGEGVPVLSLWPVMVIIRELLQASPTSDELLNDYIVNIYSEYRDQDDEIEKDSYFFGEGADDIYNLSKVINSIRPKIVQLIDNSFEGELTNNIGRVIIDELTVDFLEAFEGDYTHTVNSIHPLLLVRNQCEMLNDML